MKILLLLLFSFTLSAQCLKLDIVVVGDLSGSVYGHEPFIGDALQTFISRFDLSEETIKIGVIVFNHNTKVLTHLTSDKDILFQVSNRISNSLADGTTDMSGALMAASNEIEQNGRPGVMKIVILITDGMPDNEDDTKQTATNLKQIMGTSIFGVYMRNGPGKTGGGDVFLESISSENGYLESNYENLAEQLKKLDICL